MTRAWPIPARAVRHAWFLEADACCVAGWVLVEIRDRSVAPNSPLSSHTFSGMEERTMTLISLTELMLMQMLCRFEYGFYDRRDEVKKHRIGKRLPVEDKSPRQDPDAVVLHAMGFNRLSYWRYDGVKAHFAVLRDGRAERGGVGRERGVADDRPEVRNVDVVRVVGEQPVAPGDHLGDRRLG